MAADLNRRLPRFCQYSWVNTNSHVFSVPRLLRHWPPSGHVMEWMVISPHFTFLSFHTGFLPFRTKIFFLFAFHTKVLLSLKFLSRHKILPHYCTVHGQATKWMQCHYHQLFTEGHTWITKTQLNVLIQWQITSKN